jgi:hypothetical protein
LGKFWRALDVYLSIYYILWTFGIFYIHLGYFMTIWYILCSFGTFFPVWVSCTKKNLATLFSMRTIRMTKSFHADIRFDCTVSWVTRVARFFFILTYQIRKTIPNDHKLYQKAIKYTKWPLNIPNSHKLYQHFSFRGPPKFTQIFLKN